jgi:hypothetical protein
MPLVAINVECPACAVPFLAPHRSPSNAVQCPHCGGQHLLSRCREVDPEMLGQQTISTIRTTQEENAEYLESSRSRQLKLLLGAGGLVVLLGLGTYASVWYSSSKKKAEEAKELAAVSQTAAADKARYDEAFATAQRTLATPEWKVMMQSVRAHDRALKQAQWVYSRVPYKPMHLINYKFPQDM